MVSLKKQELDNIVEHFNIQVDNPVCFLNQETSKHFLNSSNKSDKYKLFMKASQLESMRQLQEQIETERQASLNLIEQKKAFLPKLEQELYEWEKKFKKCQSVEKLKKNVQALQEEFAWALVITFERDTMEAALKEKSKLVKSKEKHATKIGESESAQRKLDAELAAAKKSINELSQQTKELNVRGHEITAELRTAAGNYKSVQSELSKLRGARDKKKHNVKQLADKLAEEKRNTAVDYDKEREQKEQAVRELKQKLADAAVSERAMQGDKQQLDADAEVAQRSLADKQFEIKELEGRIRQGETDIETWRRSSSNQINLFGEFMVGLVEEVSRHAASGAFKHKPRGPIGAHVQVRDAQWSLAVEQCIGAYLGAFICANYDDERLMHQLINK